MSTLVVMLHKKGRGWLRYSNSGVHPCQYIATSHLTHRELQSTLHLTTVRTLYCLSISTTLALLELLITRARHTPKIATHATPLSDKYMYVHVHVMICISLCSVTTVCVFFHNNNIIIIMSLKFVTGSLITVSVCVF